MNSLRLSPQRRRSSSSIAAATGALLSAAALAVATAPGARAAVTYDASALFDVTANPSANPSAASPFRAGQTPTLGGAFSLLTQQTSGSAGGGTLQGWAGTNGGLPAVLLNTSGVDYASSQNGSTITVQPGELFLHPDSAGQYAVLRFVAPEAGQYTFAAAFRAADDRPTTTDVHALVNGVVAASAGINVNGGGNTASLSPAAPFTLAAGGTVDFAVGIGNGSFAFDGTGLRASVTNLSAPAAAVPEPGTVGLLALGLVGMVGSAGAAATRRRRRAA